MRRAVIFDQFAYNCPYFVGDTEVNNGYGCNHPSQRERIEDEKNEIGCCYCSSCPIGIEAEPEDLEDKSKIDWDGLCEDGEVLEGEYLLVDTSSGATEDEGRALYAYDRYMHRYDKKWLNKHGIQNSLCD